MKKKCLSKENEIGKTLLENFLYDKINHDQINFISSIILFFSDAVIGFTKSAYDVIESENAMIEVGFASGQASTPVTVT
jgi:hypothetical protein